jgi:hypothetical protein
MDLVQVLALHFVPYLAMLTVGVCQGWIVRAYNDKEEEYYEPFFG